MTKKHIFRCITFVLITCVMLVILCDLFELSNATNFDKRFTTFRRLEKNTVDAVYIGTSGVDHYWIAAKAYDEYGMTVYPLSVNSMPTWLFTNVLDEAFKYNDPELIIVDARAYGQENDDLGNRDTRARRVLDAMDMFSVNRIKAGFKTMKVMHTAFEDEQPRFDLSYLFSFVKFHDKWKDDGYKIKNNLGNKEHQYLGFFMNQSSVTVTALEPEPYDFEYYEPLDSITEQSLYELFDYLKDKDVEVLFVDTPQAKSKSEVGKANTLYKILEEEGYDYIHFLSYDQINQPIHVIDFDYKNDFYDEGHVNYYGAEKFTDYFAEYIDANYDLPDRRGDENVTKDWDGKYDDIKNTINKYENKNNK